MIADKFIASLGVLDVELGAEVRLLLLEKVKEFFRCGGSLRWSDFCEMEEGTRAIFAEALAAVEGEKLTRTLAAIETVAKEAP